MNEPVSYYIRQPGTDEFRGPFALAEIRQEVAAQRATRQWEAVEAVGQSHHQLVTAAGWVSVHSLLGDGDQSDAAPSSPSAEPASAAGWFGTGLGCLALMLGCGFALFAALAYGMGHANNQGNAVFQSVLVGAPILTLILGAGWIVFRHRGPK